MGQWEDSKSVAEWGVALGTIIAIVIAVAQLRANNKLASENFARQMWTDYLKCGFQHPEFGEVRFALKHFGLADAKSLVSDLTLPSQQYLWFLTVVLDACENIAIHLPLKTWEQTLLAQLRFHKDALAEIWAIGDDPWQQYYTPTLDKLVQRVLSEP